MLNIFNHLYMVHILIKKIKNLSYGMLDYNAVYARDYMWMITGCSNSLLRYEPSYGRNMSMSRNLYIFPFFIGTVLSFYRSTKLHIASAGTAHMLPIPCAFPTTCQTPCIRHIFCLFFRRKLCKVPQKIFLQTAPVLFCQFAFSAIPF